MTNALISNVYVRPYRREYCNYLLLLNVYYVICQYKRHDAMHTYMVRVLLFLFAKDFMHTALKHSAPNIGQRIKHN